MSQAGLLIVLVALAAFGGFSAVARARRAGRRAARGMREITRAARLAGTAVAAGGVLTAVETALVVSVHDWRVLVAVLALPALLAGYTVARLLAVPTFTRRIGGRW